MPIATATVAAIAAVGGLAATAYSTVSSAQAGKKMAAESSRAENIRRQQASFEEARRRREIIRQSMVTRSRLIASSANSGTQGSSSEIGGIASINSRTGEQLGAVNVNANLGTALFESNANMAGFRGEAATAGAVGDFGRSLMANSQTIGNLVGGSGTTTGWEATVTRNDNG